MLEYTDYFNAVLQDRDIRDVSDNPFLQLTCAFFNSDDTILVNQSLPFRIFIMRGLPCNL